jgi:hypothetical protein
MPDLQRGSGPEKKMAAFEQTIRRLLRRRS